MPRHFPLSQLLSPQHRMPWQQLALCRAVHHARALNRSHAPFCRWFSARMEMDSEMVKKYPRTPHLPFSPGIRTRLKIYCDTSLKQETFTSCSIRTPHYKGTFYCPFKKFHCIAIANITRSTCDGAANEGVQEDDVVLSKVELGALPLFNEETVLTEKLDGANCSIYRGTVMYKLSILYY